MSDFLLQEIKKLIDNKKLDALELFLFKETCKTLLKETYKFEFPSQEVQYVYRSRIVDNHIFENVSDFYNPSKYQTNLGRANIPNSPLFYFCEVPGFALLEVKPKSTGQFIGLSKFKLNKKLQIKQLGLHDANNKYKIEGQIKNESDKQIEALLGELFKQDYSNEVDQNKLYLKTSAIASFFINDANFDGIAYPSICSKYNGDCFAVKPNSILDNLEFIETRIFRITKFIDKNDFEVKCELVATEISSDKKIIWKPENNCLGHSIHSELIQHPSSK